MDIVERQSIIVFFNNIRRIKPLNRVGDITYVSKSMNYLIIYVDKSRIDKALEKIKKFSFVKKAYISQRANLRVDFQSDELLKEELDK